MSSSRIRIPIARPRNPVATAARRRHGGSHALGGGARRQANRRALRRELAELHPPPGH